MIQPPNDSADRMTPIANRLRIGRSVIRPISQVTLKLRAPDDRDRFNSTVDSVLQWINRRAGRRLPDEAWQRRSFELSDIGTQRAAAIALADPKYWAARLDDADKDVPLRTWVTEIGVGVDDAGDVLFGARLVSATRGVDEAFERSIPGFVKAIIGSGLAELDGQQLTRQPRLVDTEEDVEELVLLLEDSSRQADVLVLSLPEGSVDPMAASASAQKIHDATLGAAHVFVLTGPGSFMLTRTVGRDLSVFHAGVRTYRPGFRAWIDQPTSHPLSLQHRITEWNEEGPAAYERWIVNQLLASSVHGMDREDRLPAFNTVRQLYALAERNKVKTSGGSDAELIRLFEQDNEQLRRELKEQKELHDGLLAAGDAEREAAVQDANAARSQALERMHRIRVLTGRLDALNGRAETPIPCNLDNFEEWCREHLVGTVELANRAFQGVRKSEFHDPSFIYRTLLLLRDSYVPMRLEGTPESRDAYQHALAGLQLEDSATGEATKYASETYSVQYGGSRRALDRHLKGSDSRDRKYGFRLYFFWDDEGQVVVVGWLPSHLDNRAS